MCVWGEGERGRMRERERDGYVGVRKQKEEREI